MCLSLVLDDGSPTSANLGNDHGFISVRNTNSIGMRPFGESQSKAMKAYAQSGQYHTIVESRVRLTWYQGHALNLVVPIDWYKYRTKNSKRKGAKPLLEGSQKMTTTPKESSLD